MLRVLNNITGENNMKITKMRTNGQVLDESMMMKIMSDLDKRFKKAGYLTNVNEVNSSSIKIGQHMRSFSIDTDMHDRNLQCNPYAQRLTNLPYWDQRVEFNDIINDVLNKFKVSANVKSGPYTIRQGERVFNEGDWSNQMPDYIRSNMAKGHYIEPVNEKQYLARRAEKRSQDAKTKRLSLKIVNVLNGSVSF